MGLQRDLPNLGLRSLIEVQIRQEGVAMIKLGACEGNRGNCSLWRKGTCFISGSVAYHQLCAIALIVNFSDFLPFTVEADHQSYVIVSQRTTLINFLDFLPFIADLHLGEVFS